MLSGAMGTKSGFCCRPGTAVSRDGDSSVTEVPSSLHLCDFKYLSHTLPHTARSAPCSSPGRLTRGRLSECPSGGLCHQGTQGLVSAHCLQQPPTDRGSAWSPRLRPRTHAPAETERPQLARALSPRTSGFLLVSHLFYDPSAPVKDSHGGINASFGPRGMRLREKCGVGTGHMHCPLMAAVAVPAVNTLPQHISDTATRAASVLRALALRVLDPTASVPCVPALPSHHVHLPPRGWEPCSVLVRSRHGHRAPSSWVLQGPADAAVHRQVDRCSDSERPVVPLCHEHVAETT